MKKLMKIPLYLPIIGILLSFALFIMMPDMTLLITGVILFHLCGWILAAKFFLSTVGFFGTVLDSK